MALVSDFFEQATDEPEMAAAAPADNSLANVLRFIWGIKGFDSM